jgi:hypothetical protein
MEAGAYFQQGAHAPVDLGYPDYLKEHPRQGAHAPVDLGVALRRLGDAGQDLEQRGLPRPVAPNACPEPVEGMPTTSPRCTSKETSFKAQMVSLETVDD